METKTPFNSIRRIVKIKPVLWSLKAYRDKLPVEILPSARETKTKQEEYNHIYYQVSPPPFFVVLQKEKLLEFPITKAFPIEIIKFTLARMFCTRYLLVTQRISL